MVVATAKV